LDLGALASQVIAGRDNQAHLLDSLLKAVSALIHEERLSRSSVNGAREQIESRGYEFFCGSRIVREGNKRGAYVGEDSSLVNQSNHLTQM
jgi:hypothetical protein